MWLAAAWKLPSLRGHIDRPDKRPVLNEFLAVIRERNHLLSFVFMLSMVLATFMIAPYIATYMEANCHMPRSTLPWLYAVGGVCFACVHESQWLDDGSFRSQTHFSGLRRDSSGDDADHYQFATSGVLVGDCGRLRLHDLCL